MFLNVNVVAGQSERRLWRASIMMLFAWTVAWTPYALMFLASLSGHRDLITHHSNMWAGWTSQMSFLSNLSLRINSNSAIACKMSVSVNPFIYGLM